MRCKKDRGKKLRFGLIGAGRIADSYGQAFPNTTNAELAGVTDINPEAAKRFAERFGCVAHGSVEQMVEAGIEAAIVSSPPAAHQDICLQLIASGIPILCEKPVSIDVESALLIQDAARAKRVPFTMASKFRYVEDVVRGRNIVDSGLLGEVILFENTFMSYVDMSGRWNVQRTISGGGVLIDNGTHSVDIMRYFIGPLSSINVIQGPQLQALAVEETVYVTARTESEAVGRMDLSWSINKQCDDYIAIYGSKGTLRIGWKGSFFKQADSSNWVQFGTGYNKVQAFQEQLQNFSSAVQGMESLVIDSTDALASVEVIRAGYESLRTGHWAQINDMSILSNEAVAAEVAAA